MVSIPGSFLLGRLASSTTTDVAPPTGATNAATAPADRFDPSDSSAKAPTSAGKAGAPAYPKQIDIGGLSGHTAVVQISPRVFQVGGESNAFIYDTAAGLMLIDSLHPTADDAANLALAVKELHQRGLIRSTEVKTTVLSHWHPDHIGNAQGDVWAARGEALRAGTPQFIRMFGEHTEATDPAELPDHQVANEAVVPGTDLTMRYYPVSHTTSDLVSFLPSQKLVFLGDLAIKGIFAFSDTENGGSLRGLIDSVQDVVNKMGSDWTAVSGHGRSFSKRELQEWLGSVRRAYAYVGAKVANGESYAKIVQDAKKPAKEGGLADDLKALTGLDNPDPAIRGLGMALNGASKGVYGADASVIDAFVDWAFIDLTTRSPDAIAAARSLAKLEAVGGADMIRIITQATKCYAQNGASTSFDTLNAAFDELQKIDAFDKSAIVSNEAKAAFRAYKAAAERARAASKPGFSVQEYAALKTDMARAVATQRTLDRAKQRVSATFSAVGRSDLDGMIAQFGPKYKGVFPVEAAMKGQDVSAPVVANRDELRACWSANFAKATYSIDIAKLGPQEMFYPEVDSQGAIVPNAVKVFVTMTETDKASGKKQALAGVMRFRLDPSTGQIVFGVLDVAPAR